MILDEINTPLDLRKQPESALRQIADELREDLIAQISKTGGHLGAGLGVVELTVALHYVFNTPDDKLIWDVGHQAYPHKMLTARRDKMHSLRQYGGLSGFCKRDESEYDPFGAGHSSTSISAGLGMAVARDQLAADDNEVIAVIGDGAMSAGMAYEAMNNAGHLGNRMLVVLNDNDMSIAPPTGAMSAYLSRLISSQPYHSLRDIGKTVSRKFPQPMARIAKKVEQYARMAVNGGNLFEELGFYYVGPVDGHNLDHLLPVLKNIKAQKDSGPVLLHVVTQKGKGFHSSDDAREKFHAVKSFDLATKKQKKSAGGGAPSYTSTFAKQLTAEAATDKRIVAITAAMPSGTGLDTFMAAHPDQYFDVGIAEQHAVTFAAGLASEGMKPFCTIYSTFLQRAYDQVVHDVCIQKLPVRFAIDRAGLVGADGATHAGAFDIGYLSALPHMVLMAPSDEAELIHATHTAACYNDGPIAFRYPRGEGVGINLPKTPECWEIGKGRILEKGSRIAILALGTLLQEAKKAANSLAEQGITPTLADARFAKPIDAKLLQDLLQTHDYVLTLEEGASGGFGAACLTHAAQSGWYGDAYGQLIPMHLPDSFQPHGTQAQMLADAGLDAAGITAKIRDLLPLTTQGKISA